MENSLNVFILLIEELFKGDISTNFTITWSAEKYPQHEKFVQDNNKIDEGALTWLIVWKCNVNWSQMIKHTNPPK